MVRSQLNPRVCSAAHVTARNIPHKLKKDRPARGGGICIRSRAGLREASVNDIVREK
jgi:hypothetical protein